ncbi:MAG: OmpA family protein [Gammaproteobacteria bacterium]|nr:MAG: OmpA family protein [Gammaproteobacteria bacterium]
MSQRTNREAPTKPHGSSGLQHPELRRARMKLSFDVVIKFLPVWLLFCSLATPTHGQTPDAGLFGGADAARIAAEAAEAAVLSPRTWERAWSAYEKARIDFAKGRSSERVQRSLTQAELDFRKAHENADSAALLLRSPIASWRAAEAAEATRLAPAELAEGRRLFTNAAAKLERGNPESARQLGEQANHAFRQAELNALRARYLTTARTLLAEADRAKVEKLAPRTLGRARELLAAADDALVADRRDTRPAEALAKRAETEAQHAIYLGGVIELVADKTLTTEDIILGWEATLTGIADTLAIDADLSAGRDDTRDRIIARAGELLELPAIIDEQNAQILGLEDELRELDAQIATTSADRASLIRQVERQARIREQFRQIRDTFLEDEAIVLRDGDRLIIRLVGLTFASNSVELEPGVELLMNKVKSAIGVFPQSNLTVEGHTDSQGRVGKNQALSEQRAQAVSSYLTEQLRVPEFRIKAIGYGDTRPLTSNRSTEGRARNRRIDLVITPRPESL